MSEELNLSDLSQVSGGNDDGLAYGHSESAFIRHTIKAGDTLYSIARKYGISANQLFKENSAIIIAEANKHGIVCSNPADYANHIYPGTVLTIPRE